jgi:hypothetical protein
MLSDVIYVLVYNGTHADFALPCYASSFKAAEDMAYDFVRREFVKGERELAITRTSKKIKVVDVTTCVVYIFDLVMYTD